jgi:hypothetical protein
MFINRNIIIFLWSLQEYKFLKLNIMFQKLLDHEFTIKLKKIFFFYFQNLFAFNFLEMDFYKYNRREINYIILPHISMLFYSFHAQNKYIYIYRFNLP